MKKYAKRDIPFPILLLIGLGVIIGSVAISTLLFTIISSVTKDPSSLTGVFSLAALLVAGAAASFALAKLVPDGGVVIAIVSSAATALLMSVIGLIIGGGTVSFGVFLNHIAFVCISALFAFLATKTGGKRRRYR